MQERQSYNEVARFMSDTVVAADIGGTNAADDCVLWLTTHGVIGQGIAQIGTAATGMIYQLTKKGTYLIGVHLDIAAHADTDLTLAFTMNTDAAGLTLTPTNATTGILGRIRRMVLPAALAITNFCWECVKTFNVTDTQAHTVNAGSLNPGALIRVILAGAVADTHPTLNVVGTAGNWGCFCYRINDLDGQVG